MRLAALFTGGKDSVYSIYMGMMLNHEVPCLISARTPSNSQYLFHTDNKQLVETQASCLEIPLIFEEGEDEFENLSRAFEKAKEYEIDAIAMPLYCKRDQAEKIEKLANLHKIKVYAPLWEKNQCKILMSMLDNDFEIIISEVDPRYIPESWLGKKIDYDLISDLKLFESKNGINCSGEGEEYGTIVTNSPIFLKRLNIKVAEKIIDGNFAKLNFKEYEPINKE